MRCVVVRIGIAEEGRYGCVVGDIFVCRISGVLMCYDGVGVGM